MVRLQREIRCAIRGKNNAVRRAGCVKLANRRAGYLSSLPLIRAGVAQRGNPALRGSRLPPTEGRIIERFSGWLGLYQLLGGA